MQNSTWIVIPTYNERENIARLIPILFNLGIEQSHVLIVDDTSPDKTGEVVRELQKTYPNLHLLTRPGKEGLGRAYIAGFKHALAQNATAIVQMDADFSHDPSDIPQLLAALATHDVAIGSRYVNGISVINWPLHRLLLSTMANIYAATITGMPFKDATGGFRAWRASTLQKLNLDAMKIDGYGFQIAMLYRAWKKQADVAEIPIIFTERRSGQSKMTNTIVLEAMLLVWKLRLFG